MEAETSLSGYKINNMILSFRVVERKNTTSLEARKMNKPLTYTKAKGIKVTIMDMFDILVALQHRK